MRRYPNVSADPQDFGDIEAGDLVALREGGKGTVAATGIFVIVGLAAGKVGIAPYGYEHLPEQTRWITRDGIAKVRSRIALDRARVVSVEV
jgi:hypothetical protein